MQYTPYKIIDPGKVAIGFLPEILATFDMSRTVAKNHEWSGVGWGNWNGSKFIVYDFVLLNVGTWGFTQISAADLLPHLERDDAENLRIWIHEHPMGNGIPGPHNWSFQDDYTATHEPLGSPAKIVGWSLAAVHTLGGWVGRFDNHVEQTTRHIPVYPRPLDINYNVRRLDPPVMQKIEDEEYEDEEYEEGEYEEDPSWREPVIQKIKAWWRA